MKNILALTGLCFFLLSLFLLPQNLMAEESVDEAETSQNSSVEERRILASLKEERATLAAREKLLNTREMGLKTLQTEVDKKLNELRRLREEVEKLVAQKDEEENARILNLSKVYEKMDPTKAASIIATLKTDLAVDILANMKQKSAGKILNNLEGEKAASLSVAFSKLK